MAAQVEPGDRQRRSPSQEPPRRARPTDASQPSNAMCAPSGKRLAPRICRRLSSPRAQRHTEHSAGRRSANGFSHDLPHHMPPARAHRLADRHFFRASARADQKQVHQIDRANEQEKKHAGLQQQEVSDEWSERDPHAAKPPANENRPPPSFSPPGCLSRQRHCARRSGPALPRSWRPVSTARSCACRRRRNDALSVHAVPCSDFIGRKRRASDERKRKAGGRTPTISLGMPFIAGVATQNVWIGIETLAPEGVRQDSDVLLPAVSSSVKLRPSAGFTPSVAKKSGEMRMTSICSVEPGSPTISLRSM